MNFPFGAVKGPFFRGELLVLGRVYVYVSLFC